jgi:hypothetical protein
MLTEVALLAFQVNVVGVPLGTVLGWAAKVIAGWAELFCADMDPPPQPIAAIKMESKIANAEMGRKDRIETPFWKCQAKRPGLVLRLTRI